MTREEKRIEQIEQFASQCFEDSERCSAFISGAIWADNNPTEGIVNLNDIWHDIKEEPKNNEDIVLYDVCGNLITEFYDGSVTWHNIVLYCKATMWAYISDILPKGGEK